MTTSLNEIDELKLKIIELEHKDLIYKKTSIEYNLQVIEKTVENITNDINKNQYSKSIPLARFYDQRLLSYLEPIYNLLKITNERLDKIEKI
jgi:hypothetical protein